MLMTCEKCDIVWSDQCSSECPLCKAKVEIEELKKSQMDESDLFDLKNSIGDIIDTGNAFSVALDSLETISSKVFDGVDLEADESEDELEEQ